MTEENTKLIEEYKKNYISEKRPETTKDLKVGTILTQYWLNSMTYYSIVKVTNCYVYMVEIPDVQTSFDHDGGGTGTRYCMPNLERFNKEQKAYKEFVKEIGWDPHNYSGNDYSEFRKKFDALDAVQRNRYFDFHSDYHKIIRKRVIPADNGGICIPGVHQGWMCGAMSLWDGKEDREYYGD